MRVIIASVVIGLSLLGCSQHLRDEDMSTIDQMVEDLGQQRSDAVVELGVGVPIHTRAVEAVLSNGEAAVPALRSALTSDNYVLVGYAAFCLKELQDRSGRKQAEAALRRIEEHQQTFESRFAIQALKDYLRRITGDRGNWGQPSF